MRKFLFLATFFVANLVGVGYATNNGENSSSVRQLSTSVAAIAAYDGDVTNLVMDDVHIPGVSIPATFNIDNVTGYIYGYIPINHGIMEDMYLEGNFVSGTAQGIVTIDGEKFDFSASIDTSLPIGSSITFTCTARLNLLPIWASFTFTGSI